MEATRGGNCRFLYEDSDFDVEIGPRWEKVAKNGSNFFENFHNFFQKIVKKMGAAIKRETPRWFLDDSVAAGSVQAVPVRFAAILLFSCTHLAVSPSDIFKFNDQRDDFEKNYAIFVVITPEVMTKN